MLRAGSLVQSTGLSFWITMEGANGELKLPMRSSEARLS
jgi:hypothetical protein